MAKKKIRFWEGGVIRVDAGGFDTYWIQRRYQGKRWHFSLRVHTLDAAIEALRRFEKAPYAFRAESEEDRRLLFSAELVGEFLAWSASKKNSPEWQTDQRQALDWWRERLGDADLRTLDLGRDLVPLVDGAKDKKRIRILKSFYGWLRKVQHKLKANEDPTFGAWSVAPDRSKRRRDFSVDDYRAMLPFLNGWHSDAARFQAATGWHFTEVQKFAIGGGVVQMSTGQYVAECPSAKDGDPHKTIIDAQVVPCAEVLIRKRDLSYWEYLRALKDACEKAGLPPKAVTPGSFRHSIASHAVGSGENMESVSTFLGHKSPATTIKYYARFVVPKKINTID